MLARRAIPKPYRVWNARWDAPNGRPPLLRGLIRKSRLSLKYQGPFAWQPNNSIRTWEYPWCHEQIVKRGQGLHVVDVGGSLGGMQYVLASQGYRVTNVDPGLKAGGLGWDVDANLHARLCKVFDAPVQLIPKTLADAALAAESVDVVLCISAFEHFNDDDLRSTAEVLPRILKPDGVLITTIDLFLDLVPFCDRESNVYGRNIDVRAFLTQGGLELEEGNPAELYGYPEFSHKAVLANLSEYLIGTGYPAMAQCVVARRAGGKKR